MVAADLPPLGAYCWIVAWMTFINLSVCDANYPMRQAGDTRHDYGLCGARKTTRGQ